MHIFDAFVQEYSANKEEICYSQAKRSGRYKLESDA
jgi:hypothetical protein